MDPIRSDYQRDFNLALGRQRNFLRKVIDAAPSMIFVKDWEGRFILANQALATCYGTTVDQVIGKTDADFNAQPDELVHFRADDREVMSTRREKLIPDEKVTFADGSIHSFSTVKVPLINDDGTCDKVLGVATDITARKHVEAELRKSEERFKLAAEGAQVGIWSWEIEPKHLTMTAFASCLLGLPQSSTPAIRSVLQRLHREDRKRVCRALVGVASTGGECRLEFRTTPRDGEPRWLAIRGSLIRTPTGAPDRLSGVLFDITERRALEAERDQLLEAERFARAELERQVRIKDEFLATLSHELRTPLTAILGWTQLLRRGHLQPTESKQALETIETSAWAQKQLIDDLLDVGRITSGKLRLQLEALDIDRVLRETLLTARPAAQARGLHLEERIDPALGPVLGDANRLQQVFWNLLSNAVKFTPRGGRVRVEAHRSSGHAIVTVADTGVGIAHEFLPHMFERFRQQDGSVARRYHGLGIGLAIVKQLCELHGAVIRAESPGQGGGATFTVELPFCEEVLPPVTVSEPAISAVAAAPICTPARLKNLNVLLVEDDPAAREMVARVLHEYEVAVRTADSASSALAALEADPPDVLVSDIGLPGEDGYALIRKVRSHPSKPIADVPAIALTALARPEDRTRVLDAGYHRHVAKPVNIGELLTAIASVTDQR